MEINRYNYEEYFLLYTDNELDATARAAVEAFAAEHADLKEELELLQQFKVVPEYITFPGLSSLIKEADLIDETNCEEKFLLYTDNELTSSERESVDRFVQTRPAMQESFDLLRAAVLQADNSVRFPGKQLLFRYEKEKTISFGWWKMAAAAMVLLTAGALWLSNQRSSNTHGTEVASYNSNRSSSSAATGDQGKITQPPAASLASDKGRLVADAGETAADRPVANNQLHHAAAKEPVRRPALALAAQPARHSPPAVEGNIVQAQTGNQDAFNKISSAMVKAQHPVIDEAVVLNNSEDEADEAAPGVSFASNTEPEDIYITNIPIDKKHALRGLLRKATRVINKATGLNGEKSILIGSVELALK